MALDPNWFYSSLSQCCAAVVGLLGAVLASRLQQQLAAARISHAHLLEMVASLKRQATNDLTWLPQYAEFTNYRAQVANQALNASSRVFRLDREVFFGGGSQAGGLRDYPIDPITATKLDESARLTRALLDQSQSISRGADVASILVLREILTD